MKIFKEYKNIKKFLPKTILIFHNNDFFEIFYKDVSRIEKILKLKKTICIQKNQKTKMIGFPETKFRKYIKKLLKKGYSIFIYEYSKKGKIK